MAFAVNLITGLGILGKGRAMFLIEHFQMWQDDRTVRPEKIARKEASIAQDRECNLFLVTAEIRQRVMISDVHGAVVGHAVGSRRE